MRGPLFLECAIAGVAHSKFENGGLKLRVDRSTADQLGVCLPLDKLQTLERQANAPDLTIVQ